MGWFSKLFTRSLSDVARPHGARVDSESDANDGPPGWAPADEPSRADGLFSEAPDEEFILGEAFCGNNPPNLPHFLPSAVVDQIHEQGAGAWGLEVLPSDSDAFQDRFKGSISDILESGSLKGGRKMVEVFTERGCGDSCIVSSYPIASGMYDIRGKEGVYYEVTVEEMEGVVAIGIACLPYPSFRLPGWHRLSAALHLDDMQKFFEDPKGGRTYSPHITPSSLRPGDTFGCGFVFSSGTIFFTHNGIRLEDAFRGVFIPRTKHDLYAAIGVSGPGRNRIKVNFGRELMRWKPAREWAWLAQGHVGGAAGELSIADGEELPAYSN